LCRALVVSGRWSNCCARSRNFHQLCVARKSLQCHQQTDTTACMLRPDRTHARLVAQTFMSIVNRANRQKNTFTLNCLRIQCYRVARFSNFVVISTPPPIGERSIVMSVYVCQSVCLSVSAIISSELGLHVRSSQMFCT